MFMKGPCNCNNSPPETFQDTGWIKKQQHAVGSNMLILDSPLSMKDIKQYTNYQFVIIKAPIHSPT